MVRHDVTFEKAEKLYKKLGSTIKVAESLNCSKGLVWTRLKKGGCSFLPRGTKPRNDITFEKAEKLYKELGSTRKAAESLGCSPSTVRQILKKGGHSLFPKGRRPKYIKVKKPC